VKPTHSESLAEGLHPALERIAACAQNLTDASGAALALGGPEGMVCVARSGSSAPLIGAQFDESEGLSGECIRTGETAICVNASADPRVNYHACRALNVASFLYFPLRSAPGKIIGMLGVFSSRPVHFSQRDISCLRFTEVMVQEALGRTASDPDPATMEVLLRTAGLSCAAKDHETVENERSEPPAEWYLPPNTAFDSPLTAEYLIAEELPGPAVYERGEVPHVPHVEEIVETSKPVFVPAETKPKPVFVGRVVDESVGEFEPEAKNDAGASRGHRILVMLGVLLVLLVIAAVWNYRRLMKRDRPEPKPAPASVAQPPAVAPPATEAPVTAAPAIPAPAMDSATEVAPGKPLTQAINLRSDESAATVTIRLPKAIRYEGYQLANPDRIYFDLHDVELADPKGNLFDSDGLISHVRLSRYAAGISRVVFDLRKPATFSAKLVESPERLVIEIRKMEPASKSGDGDTGVPTKMTIVIDPGHGGKDLGTVSPGGLQEKDLTLDVAQRLGTLLKKRLGARVVFTRDKDEYVSLDERANIANRAQADFLISIHGNSSSVQTVRGVETYYFREASETTATADESGMAETFAADVHRALIRGLTGPRQPMRDRGVREASFAVLREAQMPAALAEISFISNLKDQSRLESEWYRQRIALALYQGIADHVTRWESREGSAGSQRMHALMGTP